MDLLLSKETRIRHTVIKSKFTLQVALNIPSFHAQTPKKIIIYGQSHVVSLRALSTFSKGVCLTEGVREGKKGTFLCAEGRN